MSSAYAVFEEDCGRATVTFDRALAQPPATVWPALTDPGSLVHWFPCQVALDLRPGGAMRFMFPGSDVPDSTGEITEFEPRERLTFTWGAEILRLHLDAGPTGSRLYFSQLLSRAPHAARDAAGWHVCLDRLAAHLNGEATTAPGTEPTPEWQALYDEYARRGFPSGG